MSELKPCPFCGGEAKVKTMRWTDGYTASAMCENEPSAHYLNTWDEDEAKAVERITEAWNTRHVETCKDLGGTGANGEHVFNCSECGCVLSLYDRDGTNTLCTGFVFDYPRYCPKCGRKVEG